MDKPAETHPFDEPLEILPKGLLAVPLGGLATTLLTLLFAWWVDRTASDFSPMGWYANGIIPIGALLMGMAAGSGYCGGSWWRGVKIGGRLLLLVLAMQVAAYGAAQFLEYHEVMSRVPPAQRLGFFNYYHLQTRAFVFRRIGQDPLQQNQPGQGMGDWGYAFRALEVAGFTFGGLTPLLILTGTPYCDRCRRYKRTKIVALVPAGPPQKELKKLQGPERQQRVLPLLDAGYATMQQLSQHATAGDASAFAELVHLHTVRPRVAEKLSAYVQVTLIHCPQCESGTLQGAMVAQSADDMRKTEIASHPVSAQFVREVRGLL